jgi:hypothetical protein
VREVDIVEQTEQVCNNGDLTHDFAISLAKQVKLYYEALEDIDTHIRSTSDPVPYIIQILKETLPEYKEWWNIGE